MAKGRDISRATQFLNDHPEIRERVRETDKFKLWKESLPNVFIDGIQIYISEGDLQKEEVVEHRQHALMKPSGARLPNELRSSIGNALLLRWCRHERT